jgi:hypothetical protein
MGQVNVNRSPDTGDRSAAAGINFLTVLLVLLAVGVLLWFLFTGPLRTSGGGTASPPQQQAPAVNPPQQQAPNINIEVPQPAPPNINVNPPGQQQPQQQQPQR